MITKLKAVQLNLFNEELQDEFERVVGGSGWNFYGAHKDKDIFTFIFEYHVMDENGYYEGWVQIAARFQILDDAYIFPHYFKLECLKDVHGVFFDEEGYNDAIEDNEDDDYICEEDFQGEFSYFQRDEEFYADTISNFVDDFFSAVRFKPGEGWKFDPVLYYHTDNFNADSCNKIFHL